MNAGLSLAMALLATAPTLAFARTIVITEGPRYRGVYDESGFVGQFGVNPNTLDVLNSGITGTRIASGIEFDLARLPLNEPIGSATLLLFDLIDPVPPAPGVNLYGFAGDGVADPADLLADHQILGSGISNSVSQTVEQFDVTDLIRNLLVSGDGWAGFVLRADSVSSLGTGQSFHAGSCCVIGVGPPPTLVVEILPEPGSLAALALALGAIALRRPRRFALEAQWQARETAKEK